MADPKTLIKDYLIGGAGRKMLQESAEEIIRDNVRLNGPELAKIVAAKLPATGKFGEGLKKIDGFKLQIFSQILAGLGEEWIGALPMDIGAKTALKQIVGGGIIGAGSGVADIIDDAGWEKAANEKADEYILKVTSEKVIACTMDMRYYQPKLDHLGQVVTDPVYQHPVPIDGGLLRHINATKNTWVKANNRQQNNQGGRKGGQQNNQNQEPPQYPINDLVIMTEKEAQASGFEPSDSYRKYKRTKADEAKVPTWTKDASTTLRRVYSAAVLTATQWASDEMLGIKWDVLRDFLEDAKKTKNLVDLETTAKNIAGRLEERFEETDGQKKSIGEYLTIRDMKYFVGSIDCDEGRLEAKTKAMRLMAAAYRKIAGEDEGGAGGEKKSTFKATVARGALWIMIPLITLFVMIVVPFIWSVDTPFDKTGMIILSLVTIGILTVISLSETAIRWVLTNVAHFFGKDEAKEEGGSAVKYSLITTAVVMVANLICIATNYPSIARLTLLGLGLLAVLIGRLPAGLGKVLKFGIWIAIIGNMFWWPTYNTPLQVQWRNTAATGKQPQIQLVLNLPGEPIAVDKVFDAAMVEKTKETCPQQEGQPCPVLLPTGTLVSIPGYNTEEKELPLMCPLNVVWNDAEGVAEALMYNDVDGKTKHVALTFGEEFAASIAITCPKMNGRACTVWVQLDDPNQQEVVSKFPKELLAKKESLSEYRVGKSPKIASHLGAVGQWMTAPIIPIFVVLFLLVAVFFWLVIDGALNNRWGMPHWVYSGFLLAVLITSAVWIPKNWDALKPTTAVTKGDQTASKRPGTKAKASVTPRVDSQARMREEMCKRVTDPEMRARFKCP